MIRQFKRDPTFLDHWLAILAIVLGGGAVIQLAYENFVTPRGTPIIIDGARPPQVLNGPAHENETLKVRVFREKTRDDCPVNSQRLLINDMTGAVLSLGEEVTEGGSVDMDYVDVKYPLPQQLPPGGYTLRVYLTYICPERSFLITQPDVHFKVTQ